ncbi:MAG: glycosyltransferase family 39 protein [Thaumarchaeota archaeon]|nr:glycosyltransferase family 39 protein [Nitrososphaerota archaeon]
MRPKLTAGLLIFFSALVVYTLSLNGVYAIDHATSFMELDYAIWTNHSFVLGSVANFKPGSVDDFKYDGNYYSALAPGTSILSLPFFGAGLMLDGHFTLFGYAGLFSEFFVALVNSAAASLVYLVGRFFFQKNVSALLAFVYAFSTISWPFATYFFQSDVSAALCLLAVYFAIRVARREHSQLRDSALAGTAVAVAMVVDYIDAVFLPIILVYLLWVLKAKKESPAKPAVGFLATALVGIVSIGLYNYVNFGTAFRGTEQLYLHASSVFTEFSYPLYLGAYLNLFSPYRGLFIYSPFLLLGVFGFYDMVRDSLYKKEALLLLACFLGIFIPYSMWYDPTGGEGFGPRFLVAAIPFLLLPAGITIQKGDSRLRLVAFALYAAGVFVNGIAGLTEAVTPMFNYATSPFLSWTLPLFLRSGPDTWWLRYVGGGWEVPSVIIVAAAMSLPIVSDHFLARRSAVDPSNQ